MAKVTFVTETGGEITEDDATGNLMEIARQNDVDGIIGACGGVCSARLAMSVSNLNGWIAWVVPVKTKRIYWNWRMERMNEVASVAKSR